MTTVLQYLVIAAVIGLILFGISLLLFGRGERMAALPARTSPAQLPDAGITGTDVRKVRFALALRGYRMSDVDWTLERLADELDRTRERLAAVTADNAPPPTESPAEADSAQSDRTLHPTATDQSDRESDGRPDPVADPDAARAIEMAAAAWFANAREPTEPHAKDSRFVDDLDVDSDLVPARPGDMSPNPTHGLIPVDDGDLFPAPTGHATQHTDQQSVPSPGVTDGVSDAAGGVGEPLGADSDRSDEASDRPEAPGAPGPPRVPRMEN